MTLIRFLIYDYVYVCMSARMCVLYIFMYECMYVCLYVYMSACM